MQYTVKKLASLAGISPRTLRYYDSIGLLKPSAFSASGYRIYGPEEVDALQQILFFRELGLGLEAIRDMVTDSSFDREKALEKHRERLVEKRRQLDLLIANVEKTIESAKGRKNMTDQEKFEGFKQKIIEDNEKKFGAEIREKYGENCVEKSNQVVKSMTEEQYRKAERLERAVMEALGEAYKTGDPGGAEAQKAAELHRQWLCCYWASYSKEAHAGLARMYVEDERFTEYYDKKQPGTAKFLRDAVLAYTGVSG